MKEKLATSKTPDDGENERYLIGFEMRQSYAAIALTPNDFINNVP